MVLNNQSIPIWVFKLGGSLLGSGALAEWLRMLAGHGGGKAVLVPGGGAFADAVRRAQARLGLSDGSAHRMALLAMAQYGYALCGVETRLAPAPSIEHVRAALAAQQVPVWLPLDVLETRADIEESWRMTSDSLAAWLAHQIEARYVVLVKNTAIAQEAELAALTDAGVVDELLVEYTHAGKYTVEVVDADAIQRMREALG